MRYQFSEAFWTTFAYGCRYRLIFTDTQLDIEWVLTLAFEEEKFVRLTSSNRNEICGVAAFLEQRSNSMSAELLEEVNEFLLISKTSTEHIPSKNPWWSNIGRKE